MGNLAGILVTGDDFTGDGVCDDGKSKLGLERRSLASLDGTRRKEGTHFPILLFQRCGNIESKNPLREQGISRKRRMLQASLVCNELSPGFV